MDSTTGVVLVDCTWEFWFWLLCWACVLDCGVVCELAGVVWLWTSELVGESTVLLSSVEMEVEVGVVAGVGVGLALDVVVVVGVGVGDGDADVAFSVGVAPPVADAPPVVSCLWKCQRSSARRSWCSFGAGMSRGSAATS